MPTLEIDDSDLDVLLRVQRQRALRDLTFRVRFPEVPSDIMGRVRATAQEEGFHYNCPCGRDVVTQARAGECVCGRTYDFQSWGM